MTLIVSWVGIDTHGLTSAYIASDSRVSWSSLGRKYDGCRKIYHSLEYPDIVGYCGDVLFPSLLLGSIFDCIDVGLLFNPKDNALIRYDKFKKKLFNEFHKYPKIKGIVNNDFQIIYINRDIIGSSNPLYPQFYCHVIEWKISDKGAPTEKGNFNSFKIDMPSKSGWLHVMGSGEKNFKSNYEKQFARSINHGTSRNIYHCFTYTLGSIKDITVGGPPQLVGIYRKPKSKAKTFGLIYHGNRYYDGLLVAKQNTHDNIEWRNNNFEICSGITGKIKNTAKKQPSVLLD